MNIEFRLTGVDNLSPVVRSAFGRVESAVGTLRGRIAGAFSRIKDSVFSLQGAFAGIGVAALAKSFLDTATEFENFNTQLVTIEGSSQKAKAAMSWITDFTSKTPYELAQVTEAYTRLRAYGLDPTNGLLKTLGDTASSMNKPIMQAVEAIADAVTGENERLKEFGIKARVVGDQIYYAWTDASNNARTSIADNNAASIESTLTAIWNEKYSGGMDRMSKTWSGMMSNLKDQWNLFALRIMESGLFEQMKESLAGVLSKINEWAENGQLQEWATQVGQGMKDAFDMTVAIFTFVKDNWDTIKLLAETLAVMWAVNKVAAFASSVSALIGIFGTLRTAVAALNGISFAGIMGNLGALAAKATSIIALLGQAGLVGAAGAAGYGIGTLLDKAYTEVSGQSLGEDVYDWTHGQDLQPFPQPGSPAARQYGTASDWNNDLEAYNAALDQLGDLPKMATGGIVDKATRLIAGEAGPEAFVPLDGGRAIPVTVRWNGMSASGGGNADGWGALGMQSARRGRTAGHTFVVLPDAKVITEQGARELARLIEAPRFALASRGKL